MNRSSAKGQRRRLESDDALLGEYLAAVRQAKRKYQLSGDFNVALLYSIPDLLQVREVEVNAAAEREGVFKILDHALTKLERAREREGRQLKSGYAVTDSALETDLHFCLDYGRARSVHVHKRL